MRSGLVSVRKLLLPILLLLGVLGTGVLLSSTPLRLPPYKPFIVNAKNVTDDSKSSQFFGIFTTVPPGYKARTMTHADGTPMGLQAIVSYTNKTLKTRLWYRDFRQTEAEQAEFIQYLLSPQHQDRLVQQLALPNYIVRFDRAAYRLEKPGCIQTPRGPYPVFSAQVTDPRYPHKFKPALFTLTTFSYPVKPYQRRMVVLNLESLEWLEQDISSTRVMKIYDPLYDQFFDFLIEADMPATLPLFQTTPEIQQLIPSICSIIGQPEP